MGGGGQREGEGLREKRHHPGPLPSSKPRGFLGPAVPPLPRA